MEGDADSRDKGEDCCCSSSSSSSASIQKLTSSNLNTGKPDLRVFFSASTRARHDLHKVSARRSDRVPDSGTPTAVDVIFLLHKAMIKNIKDLVGTSLELTESPRLFQEFAESFWLLRCFYKVHSEAEDELSSPAIEEMRVNDQNLGLSFCDDHKLVNELFGRLSEVLEEPPESPLTTDYVTQVQNITESLQTLLSEHVQNEEIVWALCMELFSTEEHERIVGSIIGRTRAEILWDMIPWLLKYLTSHEQQWLMSILQQITRNTNFGEWLENSGVIPPPTKDQDPVEKLTSFLSLDIHSQTHSAGEGKSMESPKHFVMSQDELESEITRVSSDSTVDIQEKSTMIQNLLMSRWVRAKQKSSSKLNGSSDQEDILGCSLSYHNLAANVFGCKHYKSNCKIFAPCCCQLYPCRRCHDEMNDHLLDRGSTSRTIMLDHIMRYSIDGKVLLQNLKIFDDETEIHHCPFCNLCRVGKGLGVDFFHCMKCNACMSRSLAVHICREKCFENNYPICHDYIFTSNMPVKALRCGHLMHSACFEEFTCTHYACPICSKSLGNMQAYFEILEGMLAEEIIPDDYLGITQEILCNDCEEGLHPFIGLIISALIVVRITPG